MRKVNLDPPRILAFILFLVGVAILVFGYQFMHPDGFTWKTFASDLYANVGIDFVSIGITVLGIDVLNQRREARLEKKRLIREMSSRDNGIALRAVNELRENGFLSDGSLCSAWFDGANLKDAQLYSSDLQGASFHYASLEYAELYSSNLSRVAFWATYLPNAGLVDANLDGANFKYVNLEGARVTKAQLQKAYSLRGTILPDGTLYDGRFNLKGDLDEAKQEGVDLSDAVALSKWYAVPYDEFNRSLDLRKDRSEYTDWNR